MSCGICDGDSTAVILFLQNLVLILLRRINLNVKLYNLNVKLYNMCTFSTW